MQMNSRQPEEKPSVKKISDDIARAFESCAAALSLNELSRVTGVRIELLRRFIDRKTRRARSETWDKIYPALKPFLVGPEPEREPERGMEWVRVEVGTLRVLTGLDRTRTFR